MLRARLVGALQDWFDDALQNDFYGFAVPLAAIGVAATCSRHLEWVAPLGATRP